VHSAGTIGVVTVTYNSAAVISEFMECLLKQSYRNIRLYLVDNCSCDNTLALVAHYSDPRVVAIRNSSNVGVAEGNNIGIRAAISDGCSFVVLVNNDTVFGDDLMSSLQGGLDRHQCDMIAPKICYFEPADKIWSAGGAFSVLRGRSKHLGFNKKDNGQFDRPRNVEYSPTCCMLIKKEVFDRIGLMDPHYFIYFDDADFCLRAHRAGFKLMYAPEGKLFHKVSSLIGHRSETAVRYVTRNHVYFVLKNFRVWQNVYYLPVCQAHIIVRCLLAKNIAKTFVIAQKAFWEGIAVFQSTRRSTKIASSRHMQVHTAGQSIPAASNDG
jgi:GT2 family glycosyltransferase